MSLYDGLAIAYLVCFQACAWPGIIRIRRRQSSADLSLWREWLVVAGASLQLAVMFHDAATWRIWVSPVMTLVSVGVLLWHVYRYRVPRREHAG